MTTISSLRARLVAMAALALLLTIGLSSSTNAQPCFCDYVTVDANTIQCPILLQPAAPLCRYHSFTINPGDKPLQIGCCEDMSLTIYGCNNTSITFIQGGPTSFFNFAIQPGCCIDAVLIQDPRSGCITIQITPSLGLCVC